MAVDVSVVVPVLDEEDNVVPLLEEIVEALGGEAFEVLFVDDASTDATWQRLTQAKANHSTLRCLRHNLNCGQSSAVRTGVHYAQGDLIVVLDGDGQNDPADIPNLLRQMRDADAGERLGMVAGERRRRRDSFLKRLASRVGNMLRRGLVGDKASDAGCGLKVFHRQIFLELPYFDHMHRFMSALMLRHGYRVKYVKVNHRHRQFGTSKYGVIDRLLVSVADIQGIRWLSRRCRLPDNVDEI